nr:hypothetical protein BaRGS_005706 [Batillaria attramentaria]
MGEGREKSNQSVSLVIREFLWRAAIGGRKAKPSTHTIVHRFRHHDSDDTHADAVTTATTVDIRLLEAREGKINLNVFDTEGQTALHQSCQLGNLELVKLLVKFGADVRLANRDGMLRNRETLRFRDRGTLKLHDMKTLKLRDMKTLKLRDMETLKTYGFPHQEQR